MLLKPKLKKSKVLLRVLLLSLLLLFSLVIKKFIIGIYIIPSKSMANNLIPGDIVLVNKLYHFHPHKEIIRIKSHLLENIASENGHKQLFKKAHSISTMRQNDIVVFKFPENANKFYIKRCVGLPGDTLEINKATVLINDSEISSPKGIKLKYKVWFNDGQAFNNLINRHHISLYDIKRGNSSRNINLTITLDQFTKLKVASCVDSILIDYRATDTVSHAFPWSNQFLWSPDNFGPLVIPRKDMKINLTKNDNVVLYRKTLTKFEGLEEKDGKFYKDNELVNEHIFKNNYFFMLGDNRPISIDSRFWGFVPEENIVGKAVCVLFSKGEHNIRWDRFFKKL